MNAVMITKFGMYGAAMATIISYLIAGASLLIYFSKTFNVRYGDCVFIKKEDIKKILDFLHR